jgi:hypothetical protein
MNVKTYPRTLAGLAESIKDDLVKRQPVPLVTLDHRDGLTANQVAAVVRADPEVMVEEIDHLDEWINEVAYAAAVDIIGDATDETIKAWERADGRDYADLKAEFDTSDERNELYFWLRDNDPSTVVRDLARATSDQILRVEAFGEDDGFSFEPVTPAQVLARIGFEATEHNVSVIQYALDNASPEYSVILGYWVFAADMETVLDLPLTGKVTVTNPHLFLGNPFIGGGFMTEEPLHGTVTLDRDDLRTDEEAFGYSVTKIYGGLSAREMRAEIATVPVLTWESALHDGAPGGQNAASALQQPECTSTHWSLGQQANGTWGIELIGVNHGEEVPTAGFHLGHYPTEQGAKNAAEQAEQAPH